MKEIRQLLSITHQLRTTYGRSFTLDGKLVGDIGEVLAATHYGLTLLGNNVPVHDAEENGTGRKVQIKSSMKGNFYFPYGKHRRPEYFLCLLIGETGDTTEIYNGPGELVYQKYIRAGKLKPYNNTYYTLSANKLRHLNKQVPTDEKIKRIKP